MTAARFTPLARCLDERSSTKTTSKDPEQLVGPTYGLHNDEGSAYITENDSVLDIDKGVTYTINCEDYGQSTS